MIDFEAVKKEFSLPMEDKMPHIFFIVLTVLLITLAVIVASELP